MRLPAFLAAAALTAVAVPAFAQAARPAPHPARAIRTTIPITRAFERGLAAGTRDSSGRPTARYWQLRTDYTIDARLDPATATVTGREKVVITNPSDSALRFLGLHLDQNQFAPNVAREAPVAGITSGMHITRMVANGDAVDLTAPAVARWNTQTVVGVPLKTPIPARGTGTLEVEWSFEVPLVTPPTRGDRMGRWGNRLFQVAQWYPQVAVYDDLRGWNLEPYLGASEFFNNFGSYDVRLDLPAGWLVGATGVLANPDSVLTPAVRQRLARAVASDSQISVVDTAGRGAGRATLAGDRLTWHFRADSVADFAWAASSDFVWDATRATIPGRGAIPIDILYLPEHTAYQKTGALARHALEYYSKLWMPYAFPHFTQVDGPEGGMEYPMLTMSGAGFGVTDHEIGHQWWPMMVGVNETWYGWMDEGFNQYMNILSAAAFRDTTAPAQRSRPVVRPHVGQRGRGPDDVERELRRAALFVHYVRQGAHDALDARRHRGRFRRHAGNERVRQGLAVQASVALGLHVRHEPRTPPRSRLVLVLLALHHRVGGWIDCGGEDGGRPHRGHHPAGRADAGAGGAPGRVCPRRSRAQADAERRRDGQLGHGDLAGGRLDDGARTWTGTLDFGARRITRITLDPDGRFPDRNPADNVWPRTP